MLGFWADCRICGFAGVIAEMYASVRRKISRDGKTKSCGCFRNETRQKICARQFTLWTEPAWSASRAERPASTTPAVTAVYIGDPTEPGGPASVQGKVYNLGTFTAFNEAVQARWRRKSCMIRLSKLSGTEKKTSGNEIPSCAVGAEKQMEEVLAEWFTQRYVYK